MLFPISRIIEDSRQLIVIPKEFWERQKETSGKLNLFVTYLVPLLLVLALAVFVGEFFKRSDFFFEYPIIKAIRMVVQFVLLYFMGVFFTNELMKTFGGEKDIEVARKLVTFSLVPFLLISIFTGLIPYFVDLNILGLYSFYLFWMGAKALVNITDSKLEKYILISSFVNFFVFLMLHVFLSKIANYIIINVT